MVIDAEDTPLLKAWIAKRLEDPAYGDNDVDPDVLTDYVLALLQHEAGEEAVRDLCHNELKDFLRHRTQPFVADLFTALKYKSFRPGAAAPPAKPTLPFQANLPIDAPITYTHSSLGPQNSSRKRTYNETIGPDYQNEQEQLSYGRALKQPRRGGFGGRGARMEDANGSRNGRTPSGSQYGPMATQNFPPPLPSFPLYGQNKSMDPRLYIQHGQHMQLPLPSPGYPPMPFPGPQRGPQRRGRGPCRDYANKGFCRRQNCTYEHVPPAEPNLQVQFAPTRQDTGFDEYDPKQALMEFGEDPNGHIPAQLPQIFLPPYGGPAEVAYERARERKQRFAKGRAPFSTDGPVHDRSKSTIVVENIPEENFSEEEVREFFSQFGDITEVSMQTYKRLAIVKYGDWNSANAAWKSPKVIFDNRFVKVYWFKDEQGKNSSSFAAKVSVNGNKNGAANGHSADTASPEKEEPEIDMEEFARRQEEAQKLHEEREQKKQEVERQRQELEKRQKELVTKQQEEKQRLRAKMSADSIKREDGSSSPEIIFASKSGSKSPSKSTSQAEKLRAQLAALEEEAKQLGIDPNAIDEDLSSTWSPRGRGRGRGGFFRSRGYTPRGYRGSFRGRGGGAPNFAAYSLDNRSKRVAVAGVDFTIPEKDEVLRQYLLGIGDFTDIETTPSETQITFTDRRTAEKFFYGLAGKEIPGIEGQVEVTWATASVPTTMAAAKDFGNAMAADDDVKHDANGDALMGGSADFLPKNQQPQMDFDVADEHDYL